MSGRHLRAAGCDVFLAIALLISSQPSIAQNFVALRSKYENSIVFIHSRRTRKDGAGVVEDSYGTGFLVSKLGYVMTASHVVLKEDADHMVETTGAIRSRYAQPYKLEPVREDESGVMILLFPDVATWHPVEFGSSKSVPNDAPLYTLGFPGTDLAPATGVLANKFGPKGMWQTTLPINPGNSGGPVFNESGKVIAIAMGGDPAKQQVTYAVPEAYVTGLIQMAASGIKNTLYASGPSYYQQRQEVAQAFQFYDSVDPNMRMVKGATYCLPEGYHVTGMETGVETRSGVGSKLLSLARDPDKSNCVNLTAKLVADKPGSGDELTRGWLGINVLLEGKKENKFELIPK